MAFLNIVTLPGKIDEIRHIVCNKNIDLIAFIGTRLDRSIPDGLIDIGGYEVVRKIDPEMEVEFAYISVTPSILM